MRKGIECFVEGDTRLFKQRASLPATARVVADTEGLLRFFLYDQDCTHYTALKQAADHPAIAFESAFFVRDVVPEDLRGAELLHLLPVALDGIGRAGAGEDGAPLRLFSRVALKQRRYVQTGGGLHLFHRDVVQALEQHGFTAGVTFEPVTTEPGSRVNFDRWRLLRIENDLGEAHTQERFIVAFERAGWNGADFNTATGYGDGEFVFVSPRLAEYMLNLPPSQRGEIAFEPVELI